jgi:3-hydroxyisobutyrate dehydrogenase-like beta-hydroxyacid dehydrogenase
MTNVTNGGRIQYIGKSGEGHQAKIVNQILIANTMIGVCEGTFFFFLLRTTC